MFNRFAIVKEWSHTVSAEDECIARIAEAAKVAGYQCDIVDQEYRLIDNRNIVADENTHDFIIHIHFCSSKINNLFSFVTLWNPIDFFHLWSYRQYTDNLMSHDDFLSCGSKGSLNHAQKLIEIDQFHLNPVLSLFHTLDGPVYQPERRTDKRLHYCGMNWERLGSKRGRHHELLKALDSNDLIDIYGPVLFQGVRPWKGYSCYRGEVPFDGKSLVKTIHQSGVALVLSSNSHIEAEMMSNRLFEAMAAGANIISDENPFVKKLLGDNAFYLVPGEDKFKQVKSFLNWINQHPDEALEKAKFCQSIFEKQFKLSKLIKIIYENFESRKNELLALRESKEEKTLLFLPEIDNSKISEWIDNIKYTIKSNLNPSDKAFIILDRDQKNKLIDVFVENVKGNKNIKILRTTVKHIDGARYYGPVVHDLLPHVTTRYFSFILPNERLLKNHFDCCIHEMKRLGTNIACSDYVLKTQEAVGTTYRSYQTLRSNPLLLVSGAFVFDSQVLTSYHRLLLGQMDYCLALALACDSQEIAESMRFSCRLEYEFVKNQRDIDLIKDGRLFDRYGLLQFPLQPPPKLSRVKKLKYNIKRAINKFKNKLF